MLDLFTISQNHSRTSVQAAKSITDSGARKTQKDRIYAHMEYLSQDGMTIREVSNYFQIGMHVASARIRELESDNKIIKTGIERKAQGSQSEGSVYCVAHRFTPEMGFGFQKDSLSKKNYMKMRSLMEEYASGLSDYGLKARQLLHLLHPDHINPLAG